MEILVIVIFAALLALREVIHYKERKDMLDRLMARSFTEYKDNEKPEENELTPKDDGTAELVDAKDELYGEENTN